MNKKLKTFISSSLAVMVLLGSSLSFAKPINVYYDNKKLDMPIDPVISNNRILVPMRAVLDQTMGFYLEWDTPTQTINMYRDSLEVQLTLGSKYSKVTTWDWDIGDDITTIEELDAAPFAINGHTLVPIRFVSECIGKLVLWDQNTQSVLIDEYPFEFED